VFLDTWLTFLDEDGIKYSPILPCVDREVMSNYFFNVDGTKLERAGFEYKYRFLPENIMTILDAEVEAGIWPSMKHLHCCTRDD